MPRINKQRSDEITKRLRSFRVDRTDLIADAACVDGQTDEDIPEEDEGIGNDFDLAPPSLMVYSEVVRRKNKRSWINLTVQYDANPDLEYEWEIIEVDE